MKTENNINLNYINSQKNKIQNPNNVFKDTLKINENKISVNLSISQKAIDKFQIENKDKNNNLDKLSIKNNITENKLKENITLKNNDFNNDVEIKKKENNLEQITKNNKNVNLYKQIQDFAINQTTNPQMNTLINSILYK